MTKQEKHAAIHATAANKKRARRAAKIARRKAGAEGRLAARAERKPAVRPMTKEERSGRGSAMDPLAWLAMLAMARVKKEKGR